MAFLILVVLFVVIKLSVYVLLQSAPEGFFRAEHIGSRDRETPDQVLSPQINASDDYLWEALPAVAPSPVGNPITREKIQLGKALFFDKNLSADRSLSCASCHELEKYAGGDGAEVSTGIWGKKGDRNAPTVWNSAFQKRLFWDGRARSLEQQAIQPLLNPIEMGMKSEIEIEKRVQEQPHYPDLFSRAFEGDTEISIDKIVKAIASYERTLITNDSPYDEFVRGDVSALTSQQLSGMALFEKVGCVHCHFGPNFSAASVFSDGLELRAFPANPDQLGAEYNFGNDGEKNTVWRVPSLRNVALTGPWLHNGQVDDLKEVVRIMAKAQLGKSKTREFQWVEHRLGVIENPDLTEQQVEDIVAFLHALSSRRLVQAAIE
ncbi:cytochrome c peroxidase [Neptuniibacter sp.]|uniref:cytochrome-c peroxidase n=1 Tax=Neptuniibacter sp. TaxID=1962643 RepID=UPI002621A5AB|nr:cytochrome c peroxidase [Neptuniibacter sp.]MCP4598260.1 c-type cytochrome [Neptuniibacter sp.]